MFKNLVTLFFAIATAVSINAQNQVEKSQDETAIRASAEQMVTGWNAKSLFGN